MQCLKRRGWMTLCLLCSSFWMGCASPPDGYARHFDGEGIIFIFWDDPTRPPGTDTFWYDFRIGEMHDGDDLAFYTANILICPFQNLEIVHVLDDGTARLRPAETEACRYTASDGAIVILDFTRIDLLWSPEKFDVTLDADISVTRGSEPPATGDWSLSLTATAPP